MQTILLALCSEKRNVRYYFDVTTVSTNESAGVMATSGGTAFTEFENIEQGSACLQKMSSASDREMCLATTRHRGGYKSRRMRRRCDSISNVNSRFCSMLKTLVVVHTHTHATHIHIQTHTHRVTLTFLLQSTNNGIEAVQTYIISGPKTNISTHTTQRAICQG